MQHGHESPSGPAAPGRGPGHWQGTTKSESLARSQCLGGRGPDRDRDAAAAAAAVAGPGSESARAGTLMAVTVSSARPGR
jgi:hypothetical protein